MWWPRRGRGRRWRAQISFVFKPSRQRLRERINACWMCQQESEKKIQISVALVLIHHHEHHFFFPLCYFILRFWRGEQFVCFVLISSWQTHLIVYFNLSKFWKISLTLTDDTIFLAKRWHYLRIDGIICVCIFNLFTSLTRSKFMLSTYFA